MITNNAEKTRVSTGTANETGGNGHFNSPKTFCEDPISDVKQHVGGELSGYCGSHLTRVTNRNLFRTFDSKKSSIFPVLPQV